MPRAGGTLRGRGCITEHNTVNGLARYGCDPLLSTTEISKTVDGKTAVALGMLQYNTGMFPPQKGASLK